MSSKEAAPSDSPVLHTVLSSVFYFFIIQLDWFWNIVDTIILAVIQAMKIYQFPATDFHRDFSMTAPFFLFVLCSIKLWCAKPGNRSESPLLMGFAIFFCITCIVMDIYFIVLQPYIWSWELPFHIVSLILEGIILLFSILMLIVFIVKG